MRWSWCSCSCLWGIYSIKHNSSRREARLRCVHCPTYCTLCLGFLQLQNQPAALGCSLFLWGFLHLNLPFCCHQSSICRLHNLCIPNECKQALPSDGCFPYITFNWIPICRWVWGRESRFVRNNKSHDKWAAKHTTKTTKLVMTFYDSEIFMVFLFSVSKVRS